MIGFWLLLLFFVLLLAVAPVWPYSRAWGIGPAGLMVAIILLWLGLIWFGFVVFAWPHGAEPAS